ncbi:hypothetical protein Pcinc_031791 [Petrolisthes cinctipes]|uniref:DUF7789 domain-containing protein n=1 Tax=Petrolisthes cinctipes TaxID=88211 RepID=A0AAE1K249_PETCI|nr:hypothetical protein Pcinc_031791 [Petrolisthes cinctipes]
MEDPRNNPSPYREIQQQQQQQQPEWGRRDQPITFEDLGIPRTQVTRASVFGNIRTCQSLRHLEWILLIGGLLSTTVTITLAVYTLVIYMPAGQADYVFALLLIFHSVFCVIYIVDGVFREQGFELLAFVTSCVFLIVYVVINFFQGPSSTSNVFKLVRLVRLVLTLILGTSMGGVGLMLGYSYWQSKSLIFRTVGADASIQAMCSTLFTTITLIMFDAQIVGSVVILALHSSIYHLTIEEILNITIGTPMLLAWAVMAYLALRLESKYFFSVAMTLSLGHIAYVLFSIIQTAIHHKVDLISNCRYAASVGSLVVHSLLIRFMIKCYKNFGMGLKEKVYPRQVSVSGSSLVQ